MIYLYSIILGIFIGKLLKGQINSLIYIRYKSYWALIVFLFIDIYMNSSYSTMFSPERYRAVILLLLIIQYGAFLLFVVTNHQLWPLMIIGFGEMLNIIVILANNGHMPVNINTEIITNRSESLIAGTIPHYTIMSKTTKLGFLGDIIPLKLHTYSLLSVGDVFIIVGLFILIIYTMLSNKGKQPFQKKEKSS